MPYRLPVAAASRPTAERLSLLMEGKGETRALQRHLETLCRVTGSAASARAEMEFVLNAAPEDPEAQKRYVELVEAGDGLELDSQRQAFTLLEARHEPGLHKEYKKFLSACERPSVALGELQWLDQNLPQGTTRARGLERYRRLIEHSDGVGWDQRRAAFKNGLLSAATATPTQPPQLCYAQQEMTRLIGDAGEAAAELKNVVSALPSSVEPDKQLQRYLRLLELADGVELASVREASVKLETSGDPKLRESFQKLLAACDRNATRALTEWRWLEQQKGDMTAYARLLSQSRGSSTEQVRQAFTSQSSTGSTARPPRLKAACDEMARLCGDPAQASQELDALIASMPPSAEPDKQLKRYLKLLSRADGIELPSVREAFVKLEKANSEGQRKGFEQLLAACGNNASRALAEWKWLETQQGDMSRYASLLSQSGDASTEQVHQAYLNLDGHSIGKSEVRDALSDSSILGLRAQGLNKKLARLEELLGDRSSAAQELQYALTQVKAGQDQEAVLNRYLELVEKADGVGLDGVRAAFPLTEDPKVYQAFLKLLSAGRDEIGPAASELKALGQNPDDLERYARLLGVVNGERSTSLATAFPILQKLPAGAIEQLRPLLAQGVDVDQAARDLETLYANLTPGDDPDRALNLLVRLRAEASGEAHQGVRAALTHLLKAPRDSRSDQEKNYRHLLAIEGDPALALQDLEWLVADGRADLGVRTRSYGRLLAETDNTQREPIRKALQDLAANPGPPPPSGFWSHFRRSTSREEVFEKLYRWQEDASAALKDLKTLEFHLDPDEDLGAALKEFEKLLEQTGQTANTRLAFEAIRSQPPQERKDYKKDLFALSDEFGDLELARRSLSVVRGVKRPEERQKRLDTLFGWNKTEGSARAVDMLDAAANLMINGREIEQVAGRVTDLRKRMEPALMKDVTYTAARFSRMPKSPFKTPDATLDHYVDLFSACRNASELEAVGKILEGPGDGTVHDRAEVVGGILRGLASVSGCREELTWLSQNLEPAEFLTVGKAYANLFSVISQVRGGGAQTVREQLVWAREFKRTKNPRVDVETVMTRLASKLVIGASIESARHQVEEELLGGQVIGEKDEWVIIGGTRVKRARQEGGTDAG